MEYKYKAFISYRHLEPDMQAAEKLQKLLEAYKPPKNLGKTKENWRIFRDVSELQSSSDLSEDIRNAIDNSEFLIVICSPKYNESKWCKQELTRFRELHNNTNENIITLLVNGLPQEAFPEELTYTEVTTTDENGKEVKVRMEVEPLAANITADSLKESMKRLNTEYLRIAAPLLGCDFNDLFQREKRREAARRRRIFGGVSGVLSLITVISVASAVTISGKNVRIQQQNDQIKEQNSQILDQNEQIERKNNDLLVENAGHLAVESENLYKEDQLIPAIMKAVEALPAQDGEKPVLPEAEYALSRELGMFSHSKLAPQLTLRHECAVEQLSFMAGGKSVVSQDATGIYFWDAETGKLIKKITASDSEFASEKKGSANVLTAILDVSADKTGEYFKNTGTPGNIYYENSTVFNKIYTDFAHDVSDDEPGTGGDVYVYNSDNSLWRLDGATGEIKWSAPGAEDAINYLLVQADEKYILRMYQNGTESSAGMIFPGDNIFLELIDRETGAVAERADVTSLSGSTVGFLMDTDILAYRDGILYVFNGDAEEVQTFTIKDHVIEPAEKIPAKSEEGAIHFVDTEFMGDSPVIASCSICGFDVSTEFIRCDSAMKEQKWSTKIPVNYSADGRMFLLPAEGASYEHDVLAVLNNRTIVFIDFETGSVISTIQLAATIVDASYSRNGIIMFTDSTGAEYVISAAHYTTGDPSDNAAYRVQMFDSGTAFCSYSRDRYVTSDGYSNKAYIQYVSENALFTDIDTGEYMYDRNVLAASDDGAYAAVVSTYYPDGKYNDLSRIVRHLYIYDTASGEYSEVEAMEGRRINSASFVGGKLLAIANARSDDGYFSSDDETFCIDPASGETAKIESAPSAGRTDVRTTTTDSGLFYLNNASRSISFVTADGGCKTWEQENTVIVDEVYAAADKRAAILVSNPQEDAPFVEIWDTAGGDYVKLDCGLASDEGLDIERIFWQNSNTVGVMFSNRTAALYDAATGARVSEMSLVGTGQEPISAAPVTDDTFAVLCRDSQIYEFDKNGYTGRSCRLEYADETENDIRETDSSDAGKLSTAPSADSSRVFVKWEKGPAWLLDTERFTVRYRIDDFAAAPAGRDIVFISDTHSNRAGIFPVFSTDQLIETARKYLFALGEM